MSHAVAVATDEIGVRVIGRCSLPFRVLNRTDGGYDLSFQIRSNYGGLPQMVGLGIGLEYQKRNRQWVLKIRPSEQSLSIPFPLFKTVQGASTLDGRRGLSLIKPNKHFLKQYHRSVFCKQGVLSIPILMIDENGELIEELLSFYPSVIDGKEFLVIQSTGIPLVLSR